jgi:hypothetical protein
MLMPLRFGPVARLWDPVRARYCSVLLIKFPRPSLATLNFNHYVLGNRFSSAMRPTGLPDYVGIRRSWLMRSHNTVL